MDPGPSSWNKVFCDAAEAFTMRGLKFLSYGASFLCAKVSLLLVKDKWVGAWMGLREK